MRDVKQWYVEYLAEKLTVDDKESSPLLVVASVGKEEFGPEPLASYTYMVSVKMCKIHWCSHLHKRLLVGFNGSWLLRASREKGQHILLTGDVLCMAMG